MNVVRRFERFSVFETTAASTPEQRADEPVGEGSFVGVHSLTSRDRDLRLRWCRSRLPGVTVAVHVRAGDRWRHPTVDPVVPYLYALTAADLLGGFDPSAVSGAALGQHGVDAAPARAAAACWQTVDAGHFVHVVVAVHPDSTVLDHDTPFGRVPPCPAAEGLWHPERDLSRPSFRRP